MEIAVAGMTIVFTALILISAFITGLPRLLGLVARAFPEAVAQVPRRATPTPPAPPADDLAVVAAVGGAYHAARTRRTQAA